MRVIAGSLRGRLLRGPRDDQTTRPITDRVKTSLFNILAGQLADAVVADCFAGTGSLGIEALSRGAAHVTFVEIDGQALRLLKENLTAFGLLGRSEIVRRDLMHRGLPPPPAGPFTLVFLDPPYRITETDPLRLWLNLCAAADAGALAPDATIVWRHDEHQAPAVPDSAAGRLAICDRRTYGSQTLTFIRIPSPCKAEGQGEGRKSGTRIGPAGESAV